MRLAEKEMRKMLCRGNKNKAYSECGSSVLFSVVVLFSLSLLLTAASSYLGVRYRNCIKKTQALEKIMTSSVEENRKNVSD